VVLISRVTVRTALLIVVAWQRAVQHLYAARTLLPAASYYIVLKLVEPEFCRHVKETQTRPALCCHGKASSSNKLVFDLSYAP